jgi:hypothetical protein
MENTGTDQTSDFLWKVSHSDDPAKAGWLNKEGELLSSWPVIPTRIRAWLQPNRELIEFRASVSVKRPQRELIPCLQTRIQVINKIQPAILQRTAVGFDLAKSKRVKRAAVLVGDLHNYLVLTLSFFHRDYLCRNRAHQSLMFSRSGRLESRCLLLQIRFLAQSLNRGLKLFSQTHRLDQTILFVRHSCQNRVRSRWRRGYGGDNPSQTSLPGVRHAASGRG